MISFLLYFFFFIVFLYFLNSHFFINSLLYLESISLVLLFLLLSMSYLCYSSKISLFYLVFVVCESSVGLSVLVKVIKTFGSNNFRLLNLTLY